MFSDHHPLDKEDDGRTRSSSTLVVSCNPLSDDTD